ncbi:MAG: LPP20 family lipoprotein [Deltaproteobacteria bacterium]|nr:LPP20 family lipoprotein [Deltaproteobacteria bacterium]
MNLIGKAGTGLGFLVGMLVLVLTTGCASGPEKAQPVPDWLTSTPFDDRYFYAMGISGQTRHVKDAWIQAANRARAELGRTIVSHVSSRDLVISTSKSEYSRQLVEVLSDTELNYTEIIERWYDRYGSYGPAQHYYVLVRMEKKSAAAVLKRLR